jgi:LytS/YehU family sensor histidine kinase
MPAVGTLPIKVALAREKARAYLAYWVLGCFLLAILIAVVGGLWFAKSVDDAIKLLTCVSSILSGVVGAIIVFYFEKKQN